MAKLIKHEDPALTFAQHDHAHCLAPGLFRSLKKGDRKRLKLDIIYDFNAETRLEIKGPEPLGVDDMRVLQGLIALGRPDETGKKLTVEPESDLHRTLRGRLELKKDAIEQDALAIDSSWRRLAIETGYGIGTNSLRQLQESIKRLYTVTIFVSSVCPDGKRREYGYHLLSYYSSETDTGSAGQLSVALNPRLASVPLGVNQKFVRLDMREVRALKSDASRLIHQRLTAWIDQEVAGTKTSRTKSVMKLSTLVGYVYFDDPKFTIPVGARALRKREAVTRAALNELISLGWTIEEIATDRFSITRPPRPLLEPFDDAD